MAQPTFFWHDYETFGTDPRRDRPSQFAGIRTTFDLEIIGEPVSVFCRPPEDALPHPQSCLITGITPQQAQRDGVAEAEFAAVVHEQLALPGTCGVGYNSLRFDDEFTRQLLYRNFYDPYEREWRNGNSRWDLIDLVRMCYALRPEGIEWPMRDDGAPSFRLEHLAAANHIEQRRAHDAVSDVEALIGLARLIRVRQPKLWDWFFALRKKQRVHSLLDTAHMTPVLHVSSRYPASRGCLSMIAPITQHPSRPNEVIVYDLDADPAELLALEAQDIADRVFTAQADLPEGIERIKLRTVRVNRSPALAPLSVLKGVDLSRIGLDPARCEHHLEQLREAPALADKLREVFALSGGNNEPATDCELALYDGFLPDGDKRLLAEVRGTPGAQLGEAAMAFRDPRYVELLFRYRARNWPDTLSAEEAERWQAFCRKRLGERSALTHLSLEDFFVALAECRSASADDGPSQTVLDQVEAWARELATRHQLALPT
ncbi:exodeoxyribonuclease I [Oleiagrimonas sp. C23AA]|uniref:exodeoxyribonuclease I n=1 Tax=Oleiagrimonas sp. C23AA TaxID=2719047 RepID=UPI0014208BBA|nr:exodeoxyribonuclease I [Oleiagrimonas sp. C23AA]NII10924.1 exodeoxyribonuclease I [Oleiagrimonas sp. C23AA]